MSANWFAGRLAKTLTNKKQPRYVWNIFWILCIVIILICFLVFLFQVLKDHSYYSVKRIYVNYENERILTEDDSFTITSNEWQKFQNSKIKQGDKLALKISKISKDVLEIKKENETLYKADVISIPSIIVSASIIILALSFLVIMLIITNIKNPGKKIEKLQRQYILRIYK